MANTIKTFDILPNRLEYFERRMEKVRNAALNARPPIDFFVRMGNAKTVPLPQHLISLAQANQLADTVKIGNDWFREVIPIEVEFGDLTNLGFDYIGEIQYAADIKNTQTGEVKSGFFPTIVQPIGMTDAVHAKRVAKMAPQLNAMAAKFTDYKSIGCDHCNPDGDSIERHSVYIVQSTKDQVRQGGRKGSKGFKMNLKKDDILQLGTGCMDTYTGIDVNALAAFYEMDYAVSARGPNGSPNNLRVGVGKTWELLILQTVWFGILECVSNNGSNRRELRIVFGKWKVLTFYMAGVQWQNSLMVMWPMVKVVSLKPKAVC